MPFSQYIALGILIIAIILWAAKWIELHITSLLILVLAEIILRPSLAHEGVKLDSLVFFAPFASDIIFLFLGGLLISLALVKSRVDEWFANKIIKKYGHSTVSLLIAFSLLSFFSSMWMSNTAATAMMLALIVPILAKFPEGANEKKAFLLSIPFATTLGSITTPIATPPNAIAIKLLAANNHEIYFLEWMMYTLPFTMIAMAFVIFLLKSKYLKENKKINLDTLEEITLNKHSYIVIGIFVLTISLWLTEPIHGIKSAIIAIIAACLLFSFKILKGKDFNTISWDVLILIGGGLLLAKILEVSKIDLLLFSIIHQNTSSMILAVIFICITALLTSFMSNTATANLMIPMIFILIPTHNLGIILATTIVTSTTMFLPVSSPSTALLFSQGGIEVKDLFKTGIIFSIFCLILALSYVVTL